PSVTVVWSGHPESAASRSDVSDTKLGPMESRSPPTGLSKVMFDSETSSVQIPDDAVVPCTSAVQVPRMPTGMTTTGAFVGGVIGVETGMAVGVGRGGTPVALQATAATAATARTIVRR